MRHVVALTLGLLAVAAGAQPVASWQGCTLHARGAHAEPGPPIPLSARLATDAPVERVVTSGSATIIVDYVGFTSQAQAAFQEAVDIWSTHIASTIPIRARVEFAPLGATTLGSTGPFLSRDFENAPIPQTWYPFAQADALAGEDLFPNPNQDFFYDIVGTFNSNQPAFYFGLDGNPPAGQFDFVTIALHELAHGLGFIGSGLVDDGTGGRECTGVRNIGCWGYFGGNPTGFPLVFDRFVENGAGQSFLNQTLFPNPSSQLSTYFRGQDLVLGAPILQQVFGDAAPLWAPASFVVGSSFSHWDENEFRSTSAALMTPQIARGEVHRDPGDITCAFLADMGWDLGPGCRLLTTDGEASVESSPLVLRLVGPNPAATRITLELRQQTAGNATVDIVDARGRVVRVAHSGPLAADSEIAVDVSTLAAGVYWARARTPAGTRALGFAVAR